MSKERARRRAEREAEAARLAEERARAEDVRRRRAARKRAVLGWVPRPHLTPGVVAARKRAEWTATVAILLALNILVWLVQPGWGARIGALVVSLLVAPVLHLAVARR